VRMWSLREIAVWFRLAAAMCPFGEKCVLSGKNRCVLSGKMCPFGENDVSFRGKNQAPFRFRMCVEFGLSLLHTPPTLLTLYKDI
jgi:hypothetical protein